MEGFPVEDDFNSFWKVSVVSDMEGDFDQFEEIDDDILASLPLNDLSHEEVTAAKPGYQTDLPVAVPEEFAFPFPPYDIQVGFMQHLYKALELGKIGIFESPTGTGKSLSLICGALRWLKDFAERQRLEVEALTEQDPLSNDTGVKKETTGELDWIQSFARKKETDEKSKQLTEEHEARVKRQAKLKELRNQMSSKHNFKRKRDALEEEFGALYKDSPDDLKHRLSAEVEESATDTENSLDDDDIVLEEYISDDETGKQEENSDSEEDLYVTKIYYCTRTHSQLAQFVREIQKSPFGQDTQVISLGSRQNLCINSMVRKLNSLSLINDRCLELQKHKEKKREGGEAKRKKTSGGCPFYKQQPMMDFKDKALVQVQDIEQLVTKAREMKACPYYGSRYAVPPAELVALPYNTLLHKSTRDSCGIRLKDNIIIIDEAHNLMETIANVHSVEVTGAQLTCAYSQLSQYQDRYRSRLKAKNLMYIRQILFLLSSFIKVLGGKVGVSAADQQKPTKSGTRLQTINDFLFDAHIDNLNLFKVLRYCDKSNIARKLHGFMEKYQPQVHLKEKQNEEKAPTWALSRFLQEISQPKEASKDPGNSMKEEAPEAPSTFSSPLMQITGFLEALTNTNKDGRIVISTQDLLSKSSLKFLLLNPAVYFQEILSEARAVIVAGGTMEPLSEFKDQLFYAAGVSPERILQYSCGHVISAEQLLPIAMARGPSGLEMDFTYQQRDTPAMIEELGRILYNVCNIVPGGIICFFPSYDYEKTVHSHWERNGYLQKICAKKKLYREPKKANQVDRVLDDYTSFIKKHESNKYSSYTGAVMLCVVGGKMSEGINFSDSLGRCVLMVGLPYPSIKSPELKEKMDYLNANMAKAPDGRTAGQVHYENLCMKAVNQSIGRAIRHKGDYASILLLDKRYLRPSMKTKLPGWIAQHLINMDRFGPAFSSLKKFFSQQAVDTTS